MNLNFVNSFPGSVSGIHLYSADGPENIIRVRVFGNDIFTSGNNTFITHLPFQCFFFFEICDQKYYRLIGKFVLNCL